MSDVISVQFLRRILALLATKIPSVPAALYPLTIHGLLANAEFSIVITESGIFTDVS